MSSRRFNQDTGGAKRAAERGPVYITERGRPSHVLLTFDDYERLLGRNRVVELLATPAGIEDVVVGFPALQQDVATPAALE